jgi:hypothetical protein
MWARILEYRFIWNDKNPEDNKLELIGLKMVIFVEKYPEK